jgi:hydrogenase maturation protease
LSTTSDKPAGLQQVLVLGYGSDLRGDDAVGRLVAEAVSGWEGVRALSVHQLTPELALEFQSCDLVVFADAAERAGEASLERLEPAAFRPEGHHATPEGLLELGRTLHGRAPEAWMLALPGEDFSLREDLSPRGQRSLRQGLELLAAFLVQPNPR